MKRAPRRAPRAKLSRLWARWVSSSRSPSEPNTTVCSPTTSPERRAAMPISLRERSASLAWRSYTAVEGRSRPRAWATTSAMRIAVPLGASFLNRWWVSTISTSYSSPSRRAMSASTLKATFTPTLMLGETSSGIERPIRASSSRWTVENPVVPMTARPPCRATSRAWTRLASGTENSMRMRSLPRRASTSAPIGIPRRPIPADSPASRPSAGCPGASSAPTRRRSLSGWRSATRRLPIRPAAPATTTSAIGGRASAPDETERGQDRLEARPVGVRQTAHREPVLGLRDLAHHGQRLLHRDRIGLEEHRPREGEQLEVQLARLLPVARERGVGHLRGLPRHEVGDHRDDAAAAHRHEGQRDVVVPREDGELGAAGQDDLGHLVERAGGLLDAHDVRAVADQAGQGVGLHVHRGAARDVVDHDRDVDRVRDRAEVAVEPLLGGLVVVGVHHQRAGGPRPLRVGGEVDGLRGRVRPGARDDREASARGFDHDLDHALVLVVTQGGGLPGGAAGHDAV